MSKNKKFSEFCENYGDDKYDPKKLEKELPKGYKYGKTRQGKGDHKTAALEVDGKETDMHIGGASKGTSKSFSPSWKDGHNKVKKTLKGIDKEVSDIQKSGGNKDTAKRMGKAYARKAKTAGDKIISDLTGRGRKTNVQGKGSKATRRALGEDTDHPEAMLKQAVDKEMQGGADIGDAHETAHGPTNLTDPESMGKLAGTFARIQRAKGSRAPVPDKDGQSLYAQERQEAEDAEQKGQ